MPVSMNNVAQVNNTQPINQQPKTTDEKTKSFPTKTAVVVGTGLAALAAVGIYIATRGKGAKATQEVATEMTHGSAEQLKNLQEQAKQLKAKMKNAYLEKLRKHRPAKELSLVESDTFQSIPGHENQNYIRSSKDWKAIKEYIMNLHKDTLPTNRNSIYSYYPAKARRDMLSSQIKNRLKELQTDKDWVELRKVRKGLIKDLKLLDTNSEERNTIKAQINDINDILKAKVLNIQDDYNKFHTINIDDASKVMKKRYKNLNEYLTAFPNPDKGAPEDSCNYRANLDKLSLHDTQPLKIDNMFTPQEAEWRIARTAVAEFEKQFKKYDEEVPKTQKFLKNLAQEFRASEDSKKLKEINKQIAELKAKMKAE